MKFQILAELLSKLEATSKRLEMIDLLAEFFRKIRESNNYSNLKEVIYLLQGKLVSNIKQFPKMGIAEKMILEALSLHSGINRRAIREILLKKGDIGLTAELILSKKKKQKSLFDFNRGNNKESKVEINEIYAELLKIAKTEGSGSHDLKLGVLRGLMSKLSPLETKYLLRIITSTLRVGVSTLTIIDGIALGFTEKKENRDIIEKAYNLHPDLGDVTLILAEDGINSLQNVEISYGIPIRMMLASRVPYMDIPEKLGIPFMVEYKLDGERLQIHKRGDDIMLFSRRLLDISEQYPDICQVIRENISVEKVILEGEVVAMDSFYETMLPFQVLSKRRRKHEIKEAIEKIPVSLFLFDILKLGNQDLIQKSLPQRRKMLEKIFKPREELRLVESRIVKSVEDMLEFFNKAREKGNEGIMAKSMQENSIYQAGNRGFIWIKLKGLEGGKLKDTIDVVLVGAFYGRGRRKGVYGTYIGAVYDVENDVFESFTRIASGWTDEIMENLKEKVKDIEMSSKPQNVICDDTPDVWLKPEIVIEIIGDEITLSEKFSSLGYSMRFPVFQRFREEKVPKDVTTVEEIKNLYEIQ